MKKTHAENDVGPWAKQKLGALESYLEAYHKVMAKQKFELIYIDAFAGPGRSRIRASGQVDAELDLFLDAEQKAASREFIAGSPVVALRTGRGFDRYYFFDNDPGRVKLLEKIKEEHSNKVVHVICMDANSGVQKLARKIDEHHLVRAVAFLDPYGPNLHWKTVQSLAETRKVDVIINFPLAMAINRLVTKSPNIRENWVELLDKCFGSHDWHDLAYEVKGDMFGHERSQKRERTDMRLLHYYHRRLEGAFGHTVAPSLVKNTKRAPLYYLLWASSNPRGKPIADHIMKFGVRIGSKGRKERRQPSLFST